MIRPRQTVAAVVPTNDVVGGSGSRGMRRLLDDRRRADPRIRISPGDPLPQLQRADLYVHPSYQDGYAFAVADRAK